MFNQHSHEHEALKDLYMNTNGVYWLHNWDFTNQKDGFCGQWGVTCDRDGGYIIAVELSNNNMTGTFPPSLVNLTKVRTFINSVQPLKIK